MVINGKNNRRGICYGASSLEIRYSSMQHRDRYPYNVGYAKGASQAQNKKALEKRNQKTKSPTKALYQSSETGKLCHKQY